MMAVATKKEIVLKLQNMRSLWTNNRLFQSWKAFYTPGEDGKVLHEQIALFETAMGVVKGLMHGKTGNIKQLLDLDVRYGSSN